MHTTTFFTTARFSQQFYIMDNDFHNNFFIIIIAVSVVVCKGLNVVTGINTIHPCPAMFVQYLSCLIMGHQA